MKDRFEDLNGRVFKNLTVIRHYPERKDRAGRRFWLCRCNCGNEVVVRADNLKSGHSTKCKTCADSIFMKGGGRN